VPGSVRVPGNAAGALAWEYPSLRQTVADEVGKQNGPTEGLSESHYVGPNTGQNQLYDCILLVYVKKVTMSEVVVQDASYSSQHVSMISGS